MKVSIEQEVPRDPNAMGEVPEPENETQPELDSPEEIATNLEREKERIFTDEEQRLVSELKSLDADAATVEAAMDRVGFVPQLRKMMADVGEAMKFTRELLSLKEIKETFGFEMRPEAKREVLIGRIAALTKAAHTAIIEKKTSTQESGEAQ